MPIYVVTFIMIYHGQLVPMRAALTPPELENLKLEWKNGKNCPGPECKQMTGIKIHSTADGDLCQVANK